MLAKLSTAAILTIAVAFAAAPRLEAVERSAPLAAELRSALARDTAASGVEVLAHECTARPSSLFGERTFACRIELARGETRETVTRVVTAFDGGWAVAGR